jgi:beta-lactamase regulating signal transducer with metallopeptidase domain
MGFVHQFVEPVLSAALNTLWQAALLALLVWAILRVLPRMNASTRHAVWWAALAALLLLPAVMSVKRPKYFGAAQEARVAPVQNLDFTPALPETAPRDQTPVKVRVGWLPKLVFGIWLALVLAQFGRILWSYLYLRGIRDRARPAGAEMLAVFANRLRQCGIRRRIELLVSKEIISPMAAGFEHPAVILPESLGAAFEESELDYVLLHELAHIARRDNWSNLAARLAAAFVALHPVALWMLRRIERERELACDDWVVSFTGQARPYAQSLARLFEVCAARRRVLLATGMAAGPASQLGERIEGLLRGRNFTPRASFLRVALCTLFALILAAAGTFAPRWITFARDARPAPQEARRPEPAARPHAPRVTAASAPQAGPGVAVPANGGFMAALVAAGYGELSVDEIISLKNNGVSPAFILAMRQSGWGKPAPLQLIHLCQNGVSAEYAGDIGDAGLKDLTLDEVVRLRQNGVKAEYLVRARGIGFGPFTAQEAIDLTTHGVSLDTLRALKEGGLTGARVSAIIEAHNAGLRESDVREAQRFSSQLTLEQILKLKRGGVL